MEADKSFAEPTATSEQGKARPRLVIRVDLTPEPAPEPGLLDRVNVRGIALALVCLVVVIAAIWIAVNAFRSDPPSPAAKTQPQTAAPAPRPQDTAPVINDAPAPAAAPQTQAPAPREPAAPTKSDSPPSATNEVMPDASQNALRTIRGTVRVSIQVSIDKEGKVVSATSHEPGPSRYFERLSLAAAKKWTFNPADAPERRTMLLRFRFTRDGVSARAEQAR